MPKAAFKSRYETIARVALERRVSGGPAASSIQAGLLPGMGLFLVGVELAWIAQRQGER